MINRDALRPAIKNIYSIVGSALLIGCGNNDTTPKPQSAAMPPSASVTASAEIAPKINQEGNNTSRPLIPKFMLACSYGSHNSNNQNRFVSDGRDIYFGHQNGSAFSKSKDVDLSDRTIRFVQVDPNGVAFGANIITEIHRDSLKVWITRVDFTGQKEEQLYICEAGSPEDNLIELIRSDFESKKQKSLDEKREHESRQNEI